jgi:UDP-N-acetylglucosamine--N-acetylmuramyl-(pentapeptide) pyrophosphoryl-undecaprenol N-acetylglucosamine transferase
VYPALSVVEALKGITGQGSLELLWLGSVSGLEAEIVRRSEIPFRGIGLRGGVRGVGPVAAVRGGLGLLLGIGQALRVIRAHKPQVILATGGYVSVPAVVAGWLLRTPSLVYLPDVQPGWAVRFLAPFARRIAVTTEESRAYFSAHKVVVTGYPVRPAMFGQDRKAAREAFGLDADLCTVLVMGGSRGAHSINTVLAQALPHLLWNYQIIHVTGQAEAAAMRTVRDQLPAELKRRYRPYGFLHEDMVKAFAAADLVVGRAGASVLGEIPAAGLAAILVPLATGHRDQERNADFLVSKGVAIRVNTSDLTAERLEQAIAQAAEPSTLAAMRRASAALARPDAAQEIAREVVALAERKKR